ncbi:MAG: hypothetical protein A3F73_06970 [Gallionellales bacterium RIFCSPLOWO2_12_FULL_59_22]|nr:MAG: hypothetical protein A3H99_03870 [Gallionellales bacterium RIFCSPLOWO2_02_FULL_59_110]OGT02297.1 MAG: hypothetical protein A2Z65_02345 [Gallionellales bacterium RIFCSPLOWO2_02_58_13]OGT14138.1 MAG: hypothetical protein A3F73_06970 [Gallionellales bacterium RIFCSPLOWO2_12_FULL_59_22]
MERKLYWSVAILSALIFVGSFFVPGKSGVDNDLPWQIEHPTPDTIRIFGLTLGSSTGGETEQRFHAEAKYSLFRSPGGQLVAEMFFEQVEPAGLKGRIVAIIAVPAAELQAMHERGLRISATGGGRKITPAPGDILRLRALPVSGLTYMPSVRVEEEIFLKRFGQPGQRISEKESGAVHWLYPQHGLDITLGGAEKPVLQYVPPKDFDKLLQPLLANGKAPR